MMVMMAMARSWWRLVEPPCILAKLPTNLTRITRPGQPVIIIIMVLMIIIMVLMIIIMVLMIVDNHDDFDDGHVDSFSIIQDHTGQVYDNDH